MRVGAKAALRRAVMATATVVVCASGAGGGAAAHGATVSWTNPLGGDFNNSTNWNSLFGPVPGMADTAQFNIANTYNVNLDISPSLDGVSVGGSNVSFINTTAGRTVSVTNNIVVNSGSFNLTATTPVTWTSSQNGFFNSTVSISNGNHLAARSINVASANNSTTTVSGTGSSISATAISTIGQGSNKVGTLTLSSSATGSFNDINMGTSAGIANLNVQSGSSLTAGPMLLASNAIAGTSATLTVTGAGSTFTQGGGMTVGASASSSANMTLSSSAAATLNGALAIYSTGELDVLSGATLSTSSTVTLGGGSSTHGNLIVSGTNSATTQTNGTQTFLSIGASTGTTVGLQVDTGGTYTTASGTADTTRTTINATGRIDINNGGTFNGNANILINGGILQRGGGTFNWANGRTMTVQSGGFFALSGDYATPTSAVINVSGVNSTFALSGLGALTVGGGSQVNLGASGTMSAASERIGDVSGGSVNQSGGTNTVSGNILPMQIGSAAGSNGSYTLSAGTLSVINNFAGNNGESVGFNGTGSFTQTGGDHTVGGTNGNLVIGYASTGVGTYTITNGNLTANSLYLGRDSGGQGTLTVNSGAFVTVDKEFMDLALNAGASATVTANTGGAIFAKGIFVGGISSSPGGTGVLNIAGGNVTANVLAGLTNSGQVRVWNTTGSAINLSGGSLSCDTLLTSGNPSRFNWTGGNLAITGNGGLQISSTGPLGASLTFNNAQQLIVSKTTNIAAGASLALFGPSAFTTGSLTGAGALSSDFSTMFIGSDNTSTTFTGTITGNGGISKNGTGKLTVNNLRLNTLFLNSGTIAMAPTGGAAGGTSRLNSLNLAASGKLDLTDNKLIVHIANVGTATSGTYNGLTGLIQQAYHFGAWDMNGLTTSRPLAASGLTTLGIARADQLGVDTFGGISVAPSDVIVMYTYAGDANLDGTIDGGDYGVIDNFAQVPGASGYANGDFNFDGVIDGGDYGIIDNNIQAQGAPFPTSGSAGLSGVTAVPEPSACGFAVLSASLLLRSRRRRALRDRHLAHPPIQGHCQDPGRL